MADKLISDLASGPVLVTDLLEHEPLLGPPSLKGTVTDLFSDASSVLAINRDSRQLVNSVGTVCVDWENTILATVVGTALDWSARQLYNAAGNATFDFEASVIFDTAGNLSADYNTRQLFNSSGNAVVNWETGLGLIDVDFIAQSNRKLIDSVGDDSLAWETRKLISNGSIDILSWDTGGLGFFGASSITQQPSSGVQTAGAVYTATEQVMIQEMYDALRAYGLLS